MAAGDDTDGLSVKKAEKQRKNPALHKLYAAALKGLTRKDDFLARSLIHHHSPYGIL